MGKNKRKTKIAFIVKGFPVVSETFIINQVADLIDRGFEVEIFAFEKGDKENISQRYYKYNMSDKVHYLFISGSFISRYFSALSKLIHIFLTLPVLLLKIFTQKHNSNISPKKLLCWVEPFINKKFDLIHCHFGPVANNFLIIKEILGLRQKIVTTFYGYDVSLIFNEKPADYYNRLKQESSLFFVMSDNMKERIIKKGFDHKKVKVLPVGIDVQSLSI